MQSITAEMDKYRQAVEASNRPLDEQETILGRILELEKKRKLEASQDPEAGIIRAIEKYTDKAQGLDKQTDSAFSGLINGMDSSFK